MFFVPLSSLSAQAGGGGSFGSHGGGGGDFGGDGDGGGGLIALLRLVIFLMRLTIAHPAVGVPCWIVGLIVVGIGLRRGWWKRQEHFIRRTRPARRAARAEFALETLRAGDPAFDPTRFLARVAQAFQRAQEGWCRQDLELLRPFVSDGVLERFALQLEEQRADGWRQSMDGLRLWPLALVHHGQGPQFESVTVRVPFQAEIARVALAGGAPLPGSKLPRESFTEFWTFVRRRGARTLAGEGLIEGKCPNCAAPLALNRTARCAHCQAQVKNGRFDWVLVEITQASEWAPVEESALPGFARVRERDPGLCAAVLEDRASVAFWRFAAAERAGNTQPLAGLAEEPALRRIEAALAARGRDPLRERAVGSVRTLGLLVDAHGERALLEVLWDAQRSSAGRAYSSSAERVLQRTLFVFQRPAGAVTPIEDAFTTAHCVNCGAHDAGGTGTTCAYCGQARLARAEEWRLESISSLAAEEAQALLRELHAEGPPAAVLALTKPSQADLLRWSLALARADGELDPREREALRAFARALELDPAALDALGVSALETLRTPASPAEARAWYRALVRLALVDGRLRGDERRFLARTAERLGLEARAASAELGMARLALYRESRAARRASRSSR